MAKKYRVTKHYGNDRGYSVAFRQHKAKETHCSRLHGYSLAFTFVIEGSELDHRNWLFSFGEFREIKTWLDNNFDHTTLIAHDDPNLNLFVKLDQVNACKLLIRDRVGCEAFAEWAFDTWSPYITEKSNGRARLVEVKVSEHAGNHASVLADDS